ncbi:hypothetical protein BSL82_03450 [Tardibacter chloracetimidivorans]|uniref:Uncharacterized protein n=1 Tax=Tardibacter chloracetimidivorans TaxID=1921510 RepID=A0A1L3ZS72_9SPHN|nr:hypothetical protein [Tardibacter chloracetimidivorans]API58473.1 hypothetical protein BSL82_03450 [Tardibacter chloracetimidivorans]
MRQSITNTDSIIDSRDIIDRIGEIKDLLDDAGDDLEELQEELTALEKLAEQGEPYCDDWQYGATLVHEDYFEEYTRELLEECGYIPKDFPSWIEIDWEATAKNVQKDYTSLDFDGETYWIR